MLSDLEALRDLEVGDVYSAAAGMMLRCPLLGDRRSGAGGNVRESECRAQEVQ